MNDYAEIRKKEYEQEKATIAPRTFMLNLSDNDTKALFEKAANAGLTPEELLENFLADLLCGITSNGSDERDCAENWFDRCGFSYCCEKTLIKYMNDFGADIDDFITACDEIKFYEEHPEEFDEKPEWAYYDFQETISEYLKWFNHYREYREDDVRPDIEAEIEKLRVWYEHYKEITVRNDKYVKVDTVRENLYKICKKYSIPLGKNCEGLGKDIYAFLSEIKSRE